jgi:hypothetical protein
MKNIIVNHRELLDCLHDSNFMEFDVVFYYKIDKENYRLIYILY